MSEHRTTDLRLAFEKWWKADRSAKNYPRKVWLKQDDIWDKGGYEQPVTNGDWQAFKAGAEWQKKQK